MSKVSKRPAGRRAAPRPDDPRVVRTQAAVVAAARTLFLRQGHAGTTMAEIAALAGLTKRTVYNNYADKDALFTQIVGEVTAYAENFARGLRDELDAGIDAASLGAALDDLGRRLALGIIRPEVIALRRLLIGEARTFPALATEYFDRAPGQVLAALATASRGSAGAGCCGWTIRGGRRRSSPTWWRGNRSTARCWSGRSRRGRTSSPSRGRGADVPCPLRHRGPRPQAPELTRPRADGIRPG